MDGMIASFAHRILKRLRHYRPVPSAAAADLIRQAHPPLQPGERLLGIYENVPGELNNSLWVTDRAVHVRADAEWCSVAYAAVERLDARQSATRLSGAAVDKHQVDGIAARLSSGETVWLPVLGGHDRLRDAWGFLRFLMRAQEHTARTSGRAEP